MWPPDKNQANAHLLSGAVGLCGFDGCIEPDVDCCGGVHKKRQDDAAGAMESGVPGMLCDEVSDSEVRAFILSWCLKPLTVYSLKGYIPVISSASQRNFSIGYPAYF
ncbi:hypothetical protein [Saezia sanguinis]|uniref:hypothetical protein n=1 Tax=Saezia sanguinis TaxID=1965230 RepID=UPI0030DD42B1